MKNAERNHRDTRATLTRLGILRVIHEAFRTLNEELDDVPLRKFEEAESWQTGIGMRCLEFLITVNRFAVTPQIVHEVWYEEMKKDGWRLGRRKDAAAMTHPNMVHWDNLDPTQQVKTNMYCGIFRALAPVLEEAFSETSAGVVFNERVDFSGKIDVHVK